MNITSENEARDRVLTLTGRAGHLVAGALIRGTLEKTVTAPWNHALSVTYKQVSSDDVQRAISSAREAFERLRWTNQSVTMLATGYFKWQSLWRQRRLISPH